MRIQFWGVRGSIPTPSSAAFVTSRYGGNTSCVSVRSGGALVILDGGSGLRTLGLELVREKPLEATFFFSHVHWDHIQGFPFFVPGYLKDNRLRLYSAALGASSSVIEKALRDQQAELNFPVPLSGMAAKMEFFPLSDGQSVDVQGAGGKLVVTAVALNHPGGCLGYRIKEQTAAGAKSFAYATDTEHLDENHPQLQKLAKDADILLYDAQYTEDEYAGRAGISHKGWGHSTWHRGILEARQAGVKHLLLAHHDPLHDDWDVARIEYDAHKEGLKFGLKVSAAREGTEISL